MAIAFQCPFCSKSFKVKDALAGKKANCTQCKKVITVPLVSAVVMTDSGALESLASTVLTDQPSAQTVVEMGDSNDIPLECPFCFEHVKFSATVAGKQQPCPSCRRIIKVPALPTDKPKDWRTIEHNLTMARKDDAPAPEGAWGNTQKNQAIVSREALLEARVVRDRKELAAPDRTKWYIALALLTIVGGAGGWWYMSGKAADDRRLGLVIDAAKAAVDKSAPLPAGWPAAIQTGVGTFYLNEQPPDLKLAVKHFREARSAAHQVDSAIDKAGLLFQLALAQADLIGDDQQIESKQRLPWDEGQRELRQTLQGFKEFPKEEGWLTIEAMTRRLGSVGPKRPMMAALAPEVLPSEADRAEALACVALALRGQNDPLADSVADEAAQTAAAVADGLQSPRLAALLLARKQMEQARQILSEPTGENAPLINRLAYAEGLARTGDANDLARARKIAEAGGAVEHQVAAWALLADAALDAPTNSRSELEQAVGFTAEQAKKFTLPNWALIRLSQACLRAKRPDLARKLASDVTTPGVKPWLELAALQAELESSTKTVEANVAEAVGDKTSAQALAMIAVSRHNAKLDRSDARAAVQAWKFELAHPLGFAGAALGLQDRVR